MTKYVGIINAVEPKKLKTMIETSTTIYEVLIKIGVVPRGSNYRTLKTRLSREGIDYSELEKRSKAKRSNVLYLSNKPKSLSEILVYGKYESSSKLRMRLIKEGVLKNECSECKQPPVWNNKPLTLTLDHINGNRLDNKLKNLRILCLHCHSQTPTFGTKKGVKHKCAVCHKSLKGIKKSICKKCYTFLKTQKLDTNKFDMERKEIVKPYRKVKNRPPSEILVREVQQSNFVQIGKKYGGTDNTIRKWCKNYRIDPKTIKGMVTAEDCKFSPH